MTPELLGLAIGVLFWIVTLAIYVAILISRARKRFLASIEDDGDQGADWGSEGINHDCGGAA